VSPSASVLVCVRNVEKTISKCMAAILNQSFADFEVIVVDDLSSDHTQKLIDQFQDKRIRYYRNSQVRGLSESRNQCVAYANTEYVFFTDADCTVSKTWLEEGVNVLKNTQAVGVEGKTVYVSENYKPTRADAVMENRFGGQFLTCNIGYRRSALLRVGGFDERFSYLEDRDLALRVVKQGKIRFNPKMVVYHQERKFTPRQFLQTSRRLRNRTLLYKKHKDRPRQLFFGRIAYPMDLLKILCPPLIFGSLLSNRYKSKADFAIFPLLYVRLVYERLSFWDMCVRERVLLI
jgi:GT2 family glycosyltransferase